MWLRQGILIVSTLLLSWLGMMIVHEFGHVVGAWLTGGHVSRIVLHPMAISRTDFSRNPDPLFVAWAGPTLGAAIPLVLWGLAAASRLPGIYLWRFFAGFCLIANGVYIGAGAFDRVGDAGDLLRSGSAPWQLWAFGIVTAPVGLFLWHRLGQPFGLGEGRGLVSARAAHVCLSLLIALVSIELIFGKG